MPLTPQITLTVDLKDFSGDELGSLANPAFIRIGLCSFGPSLPRIPGTAMVGKVASWPADIPYVGTPQNIKLWGNDVIVPAGTYYMISVLDPNRNVIQSGIYQFTGTTTIALSDAPQLSEPPHQLAGLQDFEVLAIASGTTITLPGVPMPGSPVFVYRGGILLSKNAGDYTLPDGSTTLTLAYESGDVIRVVFWVSTFSGAQVFELVAGAAGSSVTLPATPIPGSPVLVFRSGILLSTLKGDYTVVGQLVNLTYEAGDVVKIFFWL
jgi:hypothetical protein